MAKTDFEDGETPVTAAWLDSHYVTDGGHKHDGLDEDGHAAKVDAADHINWGDNTTAARVSDTSELVKYIFGHTDSAGLFEWAIDTLTCTFVQAASRVSTPILRPLSGSVVRVDDAAGNNGEGQIKAKNAPEIWRCLLSAGPTGENAPYIISDEASNAISTTGISDNTSTLNEGAVGEREVVITFDTPSPSDPHGVHVMVSPTGSPIASDNTIIRANRTGSAEVTVFIQDGSGNALDCGFCLSVAYI